MGICRFEEGAASFSAKVWNRTIDNALAGAVFWLPVRGGNRGVPGRRRGVRRPDLAFLQGSARLLAAPGLRAAGDDARACGRRIAARRIRQGAPALFADPGGAEARHQRVPRGRRQEFLRAWRHRLFTAWRAPAALSAELRLQPPPAGCLDHHPAGRQELPADQRGVVRAQDQGSAARDAYRAHLLARTRSSSFI